MSYLLDTHAFLWSVLQPAKLGADSRAVLADRENEVFVCAVTFWEISLKAALGKLKLEGCSPESLLDAARIQGFDLLGLSPKDACAFHHLPKTGHKDPFDRMLIWQAIRGEHTLITQDGGIQRSCGGHLIATIW